MFCQIPNYSLTILAVDGGVPAMSSTAMVNVDVLDINDNPPTFSLISLTTVTQVSPMTNPCPSIALIDDDDGDDLFIFFINDCLLLVLFEWTCIGFRPSSSCVLEGQQLRGLAVFLNVHCCLLSSELTDLLTMSQL